MVRVMTLSGLWEYDLIRPSGPCLFSGLSWWECIIYAICIPTIANLTPEIAICIRLLERPPIDSDYGTFGVSTTHGGLCRIIRRNPQFQVQRRWNENEKNYSFFLFLISFFRVLRHLTNLWLFLILRGSTITRGEIWIFWETGNLSRFLMYLRVRIHLVSFKEFCDELYLWKA